jgi:hypothetical protein
MEDRFFASSSARSQQAVPMTEEIGAGFVLITLNAALGGHHIMRLLAKCGRS